MPSQRSPRIIQRSGRAFHSFPLRPHQPRTIPYLLVHPLVPLLCPSNPVTVPWLPIGFTSRKRPTLSAHLKFPTLIPSRSVPWSRLSRGAGWRQAVQACRLMDGQHGRKLLRLPDSITWRSEPRDVAEFARSAYATKTALTPLSPKSPHRCSSTLRVFDAARHNSLPVLIRLLILMTSGKATMMHCHPHFPILLEILNDEKRPFQKCAETRRVLP
jgi:hypothetical protein